jgi:recombinational DNA repair ATPase RecF
LGDLFFMTHDFLSLIWNSPLHFVNWRCFSDYNFRLPSSHVVIYGENGSGKTSLLQGYFSILSGNCPIGYKYTDLIKLDAQFFGIVVNDEVFFNGKRGLNGRVSTKWQLGNTDNTDYFKDFFIFSYTPDFNNWLTSSRQGKLKVLDNLLGQYFGDEYRMCVDKLTLAVKGKQKLIDYHRENVGNLNVDNIILRQLSDLIIDYSKRLWTFRERYFNLICEKLQDSFNDFVKIELSSLRLRYEITNQRGKRFINSVENKEMILAGLDYNVLWQAELAAGRVLFGAQRDDFNFEVSNKNVTAIFSRGEQRLFTAFLVILLMDKSNSVLLADDIFSELDEIRIGILLSKIISSTRYFLGTNPLQLNVGQDVSNCCSFLKIVGVDSNL